MNSWVEWFSGRLYHVLGRMHEHGRGVPKDDARATQWDRDPLTVRTARPLLVLVEYVRETPRTAELWARNAKIATHSRPRSSSSSKTIRIARLRFSANDSLLTLAASCEMQANRHCQIWL